MIMLQKFVASLMRDAAAGGEDGEDELAGDIQPVGHMLHSHHSLLCAQSSSTSTNTEDEEVYLDGHSFSPGTESNHDSCYDSDSSRPASRRSSCPRSEAHEDVSRTCSDTLADEHLPDDLSKADAPSISLTHYTSKVEFALKLGYTEDQLQLALMKLGSSAAENELLEELISLSASNACTDEMAGPPADQVEVSSENLPPALSGVSTAVAEQEHDTTNLRDIVIDGSNVAMRYVVINMQGEPIDVQHVKPPI